jgi:hypothetical protein
MALTPPQKVAVYAPDGSKEMHTKPNARDLVVGAGYSWHPNLPSQPAAFAPFANTTPPSAVAQSQEVVDKVGGTLAGMAAQQAAPPPVTPDEDEAEAEVAAEPVVEAAAEEPAAETADEDADAPARGRGRRGRGEA